MFTQTASRGVPAALVVGMSGPLSLVLNSACNAAVSSGLVVIAPSGNDQVDACLFSPGSATSVITVGAMSEGDAVSSYSNTGPCVDIFAPGTLTRRCVR